MIDKLKAKFVALPRDRVQHFGMGAAAALVTVLLVWVAGKIGSPLAGVLAAAIFGFAYEGVQKFRKEGTVQLKDALAASAGGAAVAIALYLLFFIF